MTRERPMLFSAPMVNAILREPEPKTQTRRVVKVPAPEGAEDVGVLTSGTESNGTCWWLDSTELEWASVIGEPFRCPYGVPGDTIWVKETYRLHSDLDPRRPLEAAGQAVWYEADNASLAHLKGPLWGKLRPSIHMPRSFSRIELEITDVRVERLNEISDTAIMAEGIVEQEPRIWGLAGDEPGYGSPRAAYAELWSRINGEESWTANPFVWAVTFRRTRPTKAVLASAR